MDKPKVTVRLRMFRTIRPADFETAGCEAELTLEGTREELDALRVELRAAVRDELQLNMKHLRKALKNKDL